MDVDSTILEVSTTGDIILVVGPPEEKPLRLRVSSTILRSASKVFDAMFSPPWIESSRTLSPESPKDIDLPEDGPEAMKAICYAIHHRPDMIPFVDMDGKQILQAVRTIDKYDLSTAMQLVTDRWLRQQLPAKSVEDLLYMAAAASVLKNYEAFSKLTWLVMITHEGSYLPLQNDDRFRELFPSGMFLMLSERSFHIRARLSKALQEAEPSGPCDCASALKLHIASVKSKYDISHNTDFSILETLRNLMAVGGAQEAYVRGRCEKCRHGISIVNVRATSINQEHLSMRNILHTKLPDWTQSETSLCPRCLQEDSSMEKECTHERKRGVWTNAEVERLYLF